ncbi:MAG: dihydrofolate reductase, partial [Flavobacterium sp.]|nr:dihydrofolate reductase [Flavobacterium sp.]
MKMQKLFAVVLATFLIISCKEETTVKTTIKQSADFEVEAEQFADIKVLRYDIPGWENLSLKEQEFVYYLSKAGMAGRDIIWDQNYKHNLKIRKALENIYTTYKGNKSSADWKNFEIYLKRVWFANGIHHHYSMEKIKPEFSLGYFNQLLADTKTDLAPDVVVILFNDQDSKKVNLDESKGLLEGSAVNFYDTGITAQQAEEFYKSKTSADTKRPVSFGLNSKLVRDANGNITEKVWKSGGMYGPAIDKV